MTAAMICFMGLDGSGKSSCAEYVCAQLRRQGCRVELVRAAYVIKYLRGVIRLGKRLLMRGRSDPHGGDYSAYLEAMRAQARRGGVYRLFSLCTMLEFRLQIFFNIRVKRMLGRTLLVDRYIYDNIVTHAANLGADAGFMRAALDGRWKHAPRPDGIIYVRTPVEVCLGRKDDIPDPLYLQIREPLYEEMARMAGAVTISGARDRQGMLDAALAAVLEVMEAKRDG